MASGEMQDAMEPCCRICYDGPLQADGGSTRGFVTPCGGCTGSSALIHVTCLRQLYLSRDVHKRMICPTCAQEYDHDTCLKLATYHLQRLRSRSEAHGVEANSTLELEVADAYSAMGKVLCDMGRYHHASHFYELDIVLKQTVCGAQDPRVALSLNNKGVLLGRQHKCDEAEQCFNQAFSIYMNSYGNESPQVAMVLGNMSLLFRAKENYDRALQLLDRCLAIMENRKDDSIKQTQLYTARMNRSILLLDMQRVAEAGQLARECVDFGRRAFSKNSPVLANWEGSLRVILMHSEEVVAQSLTECPLANSKTTSPDRLRLYIQEQAAETVSGSVKRARGPSVSCRASRKCIKTQASRAL
eukprot:9482685-Pyramimonas_sp.AAC.1